MDKAWILIKSVRKVQKLYKRTIIKEAGKKFFLLPALLLLNPVDWELLAICCSTLRFCVQVMRHRSAAILFLCPCVQLTVAGASETKSKKKKNSYPKEDMHYFCIEEPVIFKACTKEHNPNSWRTQHCLYSSGKRTTIFSLCIFIQHVLSQIGLHGWLLK